MKIYFVFISRNFGNFVCKGQNFVLETLTFGIRDVLHLEIEILCFKVETTLLQISKFYL